jgi:formylglycine-generating enzyme required for sulfatase activity
MKQNYKLYLAALLLVGAVSMMTAGAQGSGNKPTLAVFVVGNMDNTLVTPLTTALGTNLTSGGQYALTSVSTSNKLTELQATYTAGGGISINRNALAEWGRANSISAICLVVDDKKGNDHLFSAQLIDTKDSKLSGKGSYVRTSVGTSDAARVALALAKQLEGHGRVTRRDVTPQKKWFEPEMVRVEGGTFTMGCTAEQTNYCSSTEKPTHNVTLSSFSIGKYEVTQAQWKAVMTGIAGTSVADAGEIYGWKDTNCGNIPCDDQRPAENMDWFEAVTFCNELSKKAGLQEVYTITGTGTSKTVTLDVSKKGYRLPTEAEWEYAARGCKAGSCENLLYSGSTNANEVEWDTNNSGRTTHPVGQKKPNALGIYDMSGNVWEWVYDWVGNYTSTAVTNPTGPSSGSSRVLRGGSWNDGVASCRVAVRNTWEKPSTHYSGFGLRVALPAQ